MSNLPTIIQGGMGAGVSNWRLAQAVSQLGQLGVVSGTALDQIFVRRLQDGDSGGHMRRGLDHFPFPIMAERIWRAYYISRGGHEGESYQTLPKHQEDDPGEKPDSAPAFPVWSDVGWSGLCPDGCGYPPEDSRRARVPGRSSARNLSLARHRRAGG